MSVVNGKGEGERRRQAAWFGIEAEPGVAAEGEGPFAGVVFNRPVDRVFTYRVPAHLRATIGPGQRLRVPLGRGNQPAVGYCVRLDGALPEGVERARLKDVVQVLDDPPLIDPAMLELTRWMAGYYASAWGPPLHPAVPAAAKKP